VDTLRAAAKERGIFMGAAIGAGHLTSDETYKQLAMAQYNLATAENACKWNGIQSQQGKFDFASCDSIRDFALNTMKGAFRGHNLCWGSYNPSWLKSLNAAGKRAALVTHIKAVAAHYGSEAFAWDVVNEAVTDDGSASDPLKSTDWYPDVPDYIDLAFNSARVAFGSKVKLFYNDYSADFENTKSNRIYEMVKSMKERGVPIDGVGLQMHINAGYSHIDSVKQNMQRFADLGLEIHITELDISYTSWSSSNEQKQAQIYANLLQACLDVSACKSFETWGLTDKYTWKGSDKHPLPFDSNYQPKTAVGSMIAVLTGSPSPSPSPGRKYETLTGTCQNAQAISGKLSVGSVDECKRQCDAASGCVAVDTDGSDCYTKSHCEGQTGACSGWCAYRVVTGEDVVV